MRKDEMRRRRRRRWREPIYVWWGVFTLLGVAAILTKSWRLAMLGVLLWCLYEFCLIPAACRVMTRQGFSCLEPVRGRLFACGTEHQQIKNDALWRLAGLSNPFHKPPPPPDPHRPTGMLVVSPRVRGRLSTGDRLILGVAALLTLLAVVGMVAGLLG
jgi:hypothetical protein